MWLDTIHHGQSKELVSDSFPDLALLLQGSVCAAIGGTIDALISATATLLIAIVDAITSVSILTCAALLSKP